MPKLGSLVFVRSIFVNIIRIGLVINLIKVLWLGPAHFVLCFFFCILFTEISLETLPWTEKLSVMLGVKMII